jgi:hypothetical protein
VDEYFPFAIVINGGGKNEVTALAALLSPLVQRFGRIEFGIEW